MRTQVIEIPDGKIIDKIIYKDIPTLPKTWGGLDGVRGYYTDSNGDVLISGDIDVDDYCSKNIFTTKEEAEASLALAQLTQLRKAYREGWTPTWDENSCAIVLIGDKLTTKISYTKYFLSFQNLKTAQEFLKNFEDIILRAAPLLW